MITWLSGIELEGWCAVAAIAREETVAGDKVRMIFRLVLARRDAEALTARAIRAEKNIEAVVTELLEQAVRGQGR